MRTDTEDDTEDDIDEAGLASWWNLTRYCYLCGFVGGAPWIGYRMVSRHTRRVFRRMAGDSGQ